MLRAEEINPLSPFYVDAASLGESGAILAWSAYEAPAIDARRLGWDGGTDGPVHTALTYTEGSAEGLSLAAGHGLVALSTRTPHGLVVRPLASDGAPLGAVVTLGGEVPLTMRASDARFDLFVGNRKSSYFGRVDLVRLDPQGAELRRSPLFTTAERQWLANVSPGRATLPDGTFVAATRTLTDRVFQVVSRHFDADGTPVGPQQTLATLDVVQDGWLGVDVVPVAGGVLAAWQEVNPTASRWVVQRLRNDGTPDGDAYPPPTPLEVGDSEALAPDVSGGALFVFTSLVERGGSLHLLALGSDGRPRAAPLDPLEGTGIAPTTVIRLLTEGRRGLVVFTGGETGRLPSIYALPLECGP